MDLKAYHKIALYQRRGYEEAQHAAIGSFIKGIIIMIITNLLVDNVYIPRVNMFL